MAQFSAFINRTVTTGATPQTAEVSHDVYYNFDQDRGRMVTLLTDPNKWLYDLDRDQRGVDTLIGVSLIFRPATLSGDLAGRVTGMPASGALIVDYDKTKLRPQTAAEQTANNALVKSQLDGSKLLVTLRDGDTEHAFYHVEIPLAKNAGEVYLALLSEPDKFPTFLQALDKETQFVDPSGKPVMSGGKVVAPMSANKEIEFEFNNPAVPTFVYSVPATGEGKCNCGKGRIKTGSPTRAADESLAGDITIELDTFITTAWPVCPPRP